MLYDRVLRIIEKIPDIRAWGFLWVASVVECNIAGEILFSGCNMMVPLSNGWIIKHVVSIVCGDSDELYITVCIAAEISFEL